MKYTSILTGALGLMALAACTNNDEVKMEQPKVAQTITVTYGKGADTRIEFSAFSEAEGIKGSWEEGTDKIGFIKDGDSADNMIIFKAIESGPTAKFELEGETGLVNGEKYSVVYPPEFATNGYDYSSQLGYPDTPRYFGDYDHAAGAVTYNDDEINWGVKLEPIASFLYIPKGTIFPSLAEALDYLETDVADTKIEVVGCNLIPNNNDYIEIDDETKTYGTVSLTVKKELYPNEYIELLALNGENVVANKDFFIAIPVLSDPVNDLSLYIRNNETNSTVISYYILNSEKDVEIPEGGHIYKLTSDNLYANIK